jgi:hypothetical protein
MYPSERVSGWPCHEPKAALTRQPRRPARRCPAPVTKDWCAADSVAVPAGTSLPSAITGDPRVLPKVEAGNGLAGVREARQQSQQGHRLSAAEAGRHDCSDRGEGAGISTVTSARVLRCRSGTSASAAA